MAHRIYQNIYSKTYWIALIQAAITLLLAIIWYFTKGIDGLGSIILGSCISVSASCYLAQRLFSLQGASQAKKILARFFRAEIYKLIFISIAFIAAIRSELAYPLPLLLGFAGSQFCALFAPFIYWLFLKN